jgi:hypothetical protein
MIQNAPLCVKVTVIIIVSQKTDFENLAPLDFNLLV